MPRWRSWGWREMKIRIVWALAAVCLLLAGCHRAEPETPPVDQTALEILGPDAVMGGANAGAGAG